MQKIFTHSLYFEETDRWILTSAVILFLLSLYGLFSNYRTGFEFDAPQIGTLTIQGKIKRRHAKMLYWEQLKGSTNVYLRDTVFVPKDSRVELFLGNGKVLYLEPDSMVQFDEVTIDKLEVQLSSNPKKKTAIKVKEDTVKVLPINRRISIKPIPLPFQSLESLMKELQLKLVKMENKKTSLEMFRVFKPVRLETFQLRDYEIKIVTPLNDTFNLKKNRWIQMKWNLIPLKNTTYQVELSKDRSFARSVRHQTKSGTLSIQLQDEGQYYWRVAAIQGQNKNVSQPATFAMSKRDVSSLGSYHFQVSLDKDFKKIVRAQGTENPQCDLTGLKLGAYYCRVKDSKSGKIINESYVRTP